MWLTYWRIEFFTEMTQYRQISYNFGGDEGLSCGDLEEQPLTNVNVFIQIGNQNKIIIASKPDLRRASTCSDQSFSSDSEDSIYMDMSNGRDRSRSSSLSNASCDDSQNFYETYDSTDRIYNDAFRSSNDLNNPNISQKQLTQHGTNSLTSGLSNFSEPPDLQTDGFPTMSDTIPDNQQPKRLSLPIPERFFSEAAQTVRGYRKDVDVGKVDISRALRQV